MKLTRVEVRNYRSFFTDPEDERGPGFAVELADGMNALIAQTTSVSPTYCGQSR